MEWERLLIQCENLIAENADYKEILKVLIEGVRAMGEEFEICATYIDSDDTDLDGD
jgi:hypothetical protein